MSKASEVSEIIGKNIKLIRTSKNFTQEELAKIIGVSGSYLGYLERGKKVPSLGLLVDIAEKLGVDFCELLNFPSTERSSQLKKLVAFLADKDEASIQFLNKVAIAYFDSLTKDK